MATKSKTKRSDKRKATKRILFRIMPEELEVVRAAVSKQPDAWRGMSYHCRSALMLWAHAVNAAVKDAQRIRKLRPSKKKRAA